MKKGCIDLCSPIGDLYVLIQGRVLNIGNAVRSSQFQIVAIALFQAFVVNIVTKFVCGI